MTEAEANIARDSAEYNERAARNGIEELDRHARLTALGEKVVDSLRAYWAGNAAH